MLECAVLQRHRHLSVDEEHGTNPELRAKGSRKPHSIWLPVIDNIKANSGRSVPSKVRIISGMRRDSLVNTSPGSNSSAIATREVDEQATTRGGRSHPGRRSCLHRTKPLLDSLEARQSAAGHRAVSYCRTGRSYR